MKLRITNCALRTKSRAGLGGCLPFGFTLMEIMIAIAIFTMVVAAIYATWVAIMKSSIVSQDVAAQAQRQRIALRTIEDSLMAIQSYQASPQYYYFFLENGDEPVLSFAARVPGAEFAVVPGAGHGLFNDRPVETVALVRGWLARQDALA